MERTNNVCQTFFKQKKSKIKLNKNILICLFEVLFYSERNIESKKANVCKNEKNGFYVYLIFRTNFLFPFFSTETGIFCNGNSLKI
jgi:hypothetical protein